MKCRFLREDDDNVCAAGASPYAPSIFEAEEYCFTDQHLTCSSYCMAVSDGGGHAKKNCWDHMKCGRELGGAKQHLGVCPTATAIILNKVHGGLYGGRACWVVPNTLCHGSKQGTFAEKYRLCEKCSFYDAVRNEEGMCFNFAPVLLNKLHREPAENCLRASTEQPENALSDDAGA